VGHGLSDSDEIGILNVVGMVELNGNNYTVANSTADTFELSGINGTGFTAYTSSGDIHHMVDSTAFTAYSSGGEAREAVTTFTGLDHLEGETVKVMLDGNSHPDLTVSSGSVTLANSRRGGVVHIGLANPWAIKTLEIEAGAADGTAQGKTKRIHNIVVKLLNTLGLKYGPDATTLDEYDFDQGAAYNEVVALYSGNTETLLFPDGYNTEGHIYLTHDDVFPACVTGIIPQLHTQDR
jgi:hypothetical protein